MKKGAYDLVVNATLPVFDRPILRACLEAETNYLEDCAEEGVYWEDDRYKYAPIFSGAEEYYFPPPFDHHGTVYYHTHEEPVTIPKFIGKPVKYCDFKLGNPSSETWRFLIEGLGMMDTEPVDLNGAKVSPREMLYKKLPPTLSPQKCVEMVKNEKIMSRLTLAVDVKGRKNDEYRHYKIMYRRLYNLLDTSRFNNPNILIFWI